MLAEREGRRAQRQLPSVLQRSWCKGLAKVLQRSWGNGLGDGEERMIIIQKKSTQRAAQPSGLQKRGQCRPPRETQPKLPIYSYRARNMAAVWR